MMSNCVWVLHAPISTAPNDIALRHASSRRMWLQKNTHLDKEFPLTAGTAPKGPLTDKHLGWDFVKLAANRGSGQQL